MNSAIICIGNRFVEKDAAGLQVYDLLRARQPLPPEVTLVEGGLAGLNLLPLLEQGGRVVFIDAIEGYGSQGDIVLLSHEEILATAPRRHYGHDAGLPYLLTILPMVCDGPLPSEILLIGLEGKCSPEQIRQAADLCIAITARGFKGHD